MKKRLIDKVKSLEKLGEVRKFGAIPSRKVKENKNLPPHMDYSHKGVGAFSKIAGELKQATSKPMVGITRPNASAKGNPTYPKPTTHTTLFCIINLPNSPVSSPSWLP